MKIKGFKDTINWYEANAENYSQSIQNLSSLKLIDKFLSLIPKNSLILDAGCAAGRDSKIIHDKGYRVIGVDLVKNLINIAKKKYPEINFVYGDILKLPFNEEYFDGIWAHASLLHFETESEVMLALKEFKRVLKIRGIVHIYVKEKTKQKYGIVEDIISRHQRFFQFFTKDEIKKYLLEAGYKIINIKNDPDMAGRKDVRWIIALASKDKKF